MASVTGAMEARRVAKWRKKIAWTFGLLCSKSFTYEGAMVGKIQDELGIPLTDVAKVNVKGKFILWRRSTGEQVDIPLKEMHAFTREGCKLCPDFAAEHADISTGGLGQSDGWTLTVVRTERGSEWMKELADAGWITVRPGSEDPAAVALMGKLASKQRKRWPADLPEGRSAPGVLAPE
jgi:coenzyme F420 hydrogenase subunit beta